MTGMAIQAAAGPRADCPFCLIVAGRLESSQVHADEDVIAFMDIRPVQPIWSRLGQQRMPDTGQETATRQVAEPAQLARYVRDG